MSTKKLVFTVINDLSNDRRMHRICKTLSDRSYEVLLCGRLLKSSKNSKKNAWSQKRFKCIFNSGKLFYLEYNLRLFFYLLFIKCDAICSVDTDTLSACGMAALLRRKKLVYDAHEYFTQVPEVVNRPLVKYIWKIIENIFIRHTNLRYTVSDSIADAFEKRSGKKFYVIRNVPTTYKVKREVNSKIKYILYQGALNEGRGLEALINAMPLINKSVILYIAGEGDLTEGLKKLVKKNQLESRIKFLGMLNPMQLIPLMQEAFIGYNLLEKKGLSYYWALNNKFFDYIHAEIPVMVPSFPEFNKIIKKYEVGPVLEPEKNRIAEVVNSLLENKELHNKYKANCIRAKNEYNWENESLILLKLYEQLFN